MGRCRSPAAARHPDIAAFDEEGRPRGPKTRLHLLNEAKAGRFTDIFVFSHGWNNDFWHATVLYREFLDGYRASVESSWITVAM